MAAEESGSTGGGSSQAPPTPAGRRELIMVGAPEADLRISPTHATSRSGMDTGTLAAVAEAPDVVITPLFGPSEDRVLASDVPDTTAVGPDGTGPRLRAEMARFYHVDAPDRRLDEIAEQLRRSPAVETAYIKPPADLATVADRLREPLNDMAPDLTDAPPATPDFTNRQGIPRRGARWCRRTLGLDTAGWARRWRPCRRLRVGLAVHPRRPRPEPGWRDRGHGRPDPQQ
jgi:hypothetical protein